MRIYQILSRRPAKSRVDFSTDPTPGSPCSQLKKLSFLLSSSQIGPDDIDNCTEGLAFWREFSYRKIFTGTTHEQFVATDNNDPLAIDWLIAVAAIDNEHYRNSKIK